MSPGLGTVALAATLAWVDPAEIREDAGEVLADDRYEFCDVDGEFVPIGSERDFCELLDTATETCPGYREACLREPETTDPFELDPDALGEGSERDETTLNPGRGRPKKAEPEPEPIEIPAGLARVAQVLMWILLALGLGWLIYAIFKNRAETAPHERREDDPPPDDAGPEPAAAPAAARIVETDVERLLRLSQEAASRGDYRTAVDAAHAALLRRLDGEGLIEITVDKTNGDYLRQVGHKNGQLRQELRPIVREVERVQFGTGEPDRSMFQRIFDKVLPVVRRTVLVLAAGWSLGTLSGCDDDDTAGEALSEQARAAEHRELGGLSTEPLGARAVVQLLRRNGVDAVHRTRTVDQLTTTHGTVVVAGEVDLLDDEWTALLDWANEGNHLVLAVDGVLPDRLGIHAFVPLEPPQPRGEAYYDEYGVVSYDEPPPLGTLRVADGFEYEFYSPLELRVPVWRRLQTDDGDDIGEGYYVEAPGGDDEEPGYRWQQLIDGGGQAYAATTAVGPDEGAGRITVFADSLLFTNAGIAVQDNGALVVDLLDGFLGGEDDWTTHVEFVNSWTGAGAQSPMEAIQNSHLTPLLLQLLASLILFYWWRGAAFGTLRDPPEGSRRSFAEHVNALGLQYAKARASKHALSLYAGFAIERLRERLRPGTGGIYALAQAAAAQTGRDESELMTLLVEMHELRDNKSSLNDFRDHVNLMRQIHDLLQRTGGAR